MNEPKNLVKRMGLMPLKMFSSLLNNKKIRNANVTSQDPRRGEEIDGKEIIRLRSSSTRNKATLSRPVRVSTLIDLTNQLQDVHDFIEIMHVNRMQFLRTTCEGMKLMTSTHMPSLNKWSLKVATQELTDTYKGGGFSIRYADAHMQL